MTQSMSPRQPRSKCSFTVPDHGEFVTGATLGSGSFGVVIEVVCVKTSVAYALKKIVFADVLAQFKNEFDATRAVETEVMAMRYVSGVPHAVQIVTTWETERSTYFLLAKAPGRLLADIVCSGGAMDLCDVHRYFTELVTVVHECHTRGIVHRDIKLHNILACPSHGVTLIDFGLAAFHDSCQVGGNCGSPKFAAPEVWGKKGEINGVAADTWSLGIVLYTMLCGEVPFSGNDQRDLLATMREGRMRPFKGSVPASWQRLCLDLLSVAVELRPKLADVISQLGAPGGPILG